MNSLKAVNKSWIPTGIMLLLLFVFLMGGNLKAQNAPPQGGGNQAARPPQTLRAPDVIPGTLPEMRETSYWIARMSNPDEVILTTQQIQNRNRTFVQRLENYSQLDSLIQRQINADLTSRPGLLTSIPDVTNKSHAEISAMVTGWIDGQITFLTRRRGSTNILGIPYADWEIANMSAEMASAKDPGRVGVQPAITVKSSLLRIVPSLRPEYTSASGAWDMWIYDVLPIATSVKILSRSVTGAYLFILTEKGYGWVNSEDVALGSAEEINNFCNARDFILCTGERVPFYSDPGCTYVSGWFRMGDRLGVSGNSNREVIVPIRLIDGKLSLQRAWLREDADVHRGYLPYTRRNIVLQSFKLLDFIYDWSGGWYGRDHAKTQRDIFATFGFNFPSMGGLHLAYQPIEKITYVREGKEMQMKAISAADPFTTIMICGGGHSLIYLGNYNDMPIMLDTHGYQYTDENGNNNVMRRLTVQTVNFPDYFLTRDPIWFIELK